MLKIVLDPPPKNFFLSGIEDFAALGAYIIDYIRVLVPNGVYLIQGHRKQGHGYQYYVQWRGYRISDASWEPEHAFSNDGKILTEYKEQHHL